MTRMASRLPNSGRLAIENARNAMSFGSIMDAEEPHMPMHWRKLALVAALCWVAPLSAHQRSDVPDQQRHVGRCPHERAMAAAAPSDTAVGEVPLFNAGRRAFLP